MEITIKKLELEQLASFWQVFSQLLKAGFPGYSQAVVDYFLEKTYNMTNFNYWLASGWKIVFVSLVNEKIVGFAVLDKPYGGVCFCRWLGVLLEYRSKGIGKRLVEIWISYAQDLGCHKVEIASQPESKDFYEKCGLKLEGKRKLSYFGIDQYIFGKVIGSPKDEVMTRE